MKAEIESSKEFLDALRKARDKNPACKVKPRVTAQSKGIASYKGIFRSLEEAESSDKHIRILPARDGHVYEMRCTEAGRFLARADNVRELSEVSAGFVPAFPPVPYELFRRVLAFFRHHMRDGRAYRTTSLPAAAYPRKIGEDRRRGRGSHRGEEPCPPEFHRGGPRAQ